MELTNGQLHMELSPIAYEMMKEFLSWIELEILNGTKEEKYGMIVIDCIIEDKEKQAMIMDLIFMANQLTMLDTINITLN
jgi:hypothetical protein